MHSIWIISIDSKYSNDKNRFADFVDVLRRLHTATTPTYFFYSRNAVTTVSFIFSRNYRTQSWYSVEFTEFHNF